jgi:hypothetical protein
MGKAITKSDSRGLSVMNRVERRVTPAPPGQRTAMVPRFINEQGRELDRVVFSRTAGA